MWGVMILSIRYGRRAAGTPSRRRPLKQNARFCKNAHRGAAIVAVEARFVRSRSEPA
jgi:hypothetical protein